MKTYTLRKTAGRYVEGDWIMDGTPTSSTFEEEVAEFEHIYAGDRRVDLPDGRTVLSSPNGRNRQEVVVDPADRTITKRETDPRGRLVDIVQWRES